MNQSEHINELAAALAKAQGAIQPAAKDRENPAFRSRYADLTSIWEACRGPLSDNGLSIVQFPVDAEPGRVALETTLLHASGQWLRERVSTRLTKDDPQGVGSALTYLKRYALAAVAGVVADDDDDGNAASQGRGPQRPQPATYQKPRETPPRLSSQEAPAAPAEKPSAGITAAEAEQRFLAKYGPFEEHYRGIPRPTTVAGWISAGKTLQERLQREDADAVDAVLAGAGGGR